MEKIHRPVEADLISAPVVGHKLVTNFLNVLTVTSCQYFVAVVVRKLFVIVLANDPTFSNRCRFIKINLDPKIQGSYTLLSERLTENHHLAEPTFVPNTTMFDKFFVNCASFCLSFISIFFARFRPRIAFRRNGKKVDSLSRRSRG